MTRIQTRMKALLATALLTTAFSVNAQEAPENYVPYPHAFVSLQGGVQNTGTRTYNNWKLFTPTASVSAGVHFTPVIGARLHFNGIWNKSGVDSKRFGIDAKYKYKYLTSDLDAMVNVINLFTKNQYRPCNIYLIGGIGLNYAWDTEEVPELGYFVSRSNIKNRFSHNFRIGGMLDVKVARNWSVNLEVDANSLSDRFNCKLSGSDDWQFTAQLGITYRIGLRHKVKDTPAPNILVDPSTIDTDTDTGSAGTSVDIDKPEPAPEPTPEPAPVVDESITRNIFFTLRGTEVSSTEQTKVAEVTKWLKDHPTAKVTVTGYADTGTGTEAINTRYAKQRAEVVTKALVKAGIKADRITTSSSLTQPFPADTRVEKNDNRVTIVIGKE